MPLLDHFRPPLRVTHPWTSVHSAWAAEMVRTLNAGVLPAPFYALPEANLGGEVEIDVASVHELGCDLPAGGTGAWKAPAPAATAAVDFAAIDSFEVKVLYNEGGPRLVAAVELVSPSNKDRPSQMRAFAVKCANYLRQRASVTIVDIVTDRSGDLHRALLDVMRLDPEQVGPRPAAQFATAYRVVTNGGAERLELWPEPLAVGEPLPTLPLWLGIDIVVPLNLEDSYLAACRGLRIRV